MDVTRIAAFSSHNNGGNPAGVAMFETLPDAMEMQKIAAEIGYSETAFLEPLAEGWRIRYFAPEQEVAFCGHATIASAAELGRRYGAGSYLLHLNDAQISVEAFKSKTGEWSASLNSPPTWSTLVSFDEFKTVLENFRITPADMDARFPLAVAGAGARHLMIGLADHEQLKTMSYNFDIIKNIMIERDLTTLNLFYCESDTVFHSRNPFAFGGVYEDPATGAAAAALGGYLRDVSFIKKETAITVHQGVDMGSPSLLQVRIDKDKGQSVTVSGETRVIE
ncbi:PhzF family phenazine biosynthesis protein [Sneathiella aquimaris]|uniref:PhzF family phenazine biosynthesis protein n=1 Tax=Sneathiella aquimaris TaxID=2599305 RepID=UPI00146F017D|nr:PhzF family phenazine biosynthesis protein [Sneathiella aquimaris]